MAFDWNQGTIINTQKEQKRVQLLQQSQEAQQKAKQASSVWGMTKNFVKSLPEGFIKTVTLGGNIPKFIHSVKEVPQVWKTGKATQEEYDMPILGKQKSFISEAETRAGDIVEGKDWVEPITGKVTPRPLWSALSPFVEVPATGLAMIPGMQAITGDVALTGSTAMNLKVPEWVNKGGQIQIQPQLSPGQVIPSQIPQITKDTYQSGKKFFTKTAETNAQNKVIDSMIDKRPTETQIKDAREQGLYKDGKIQPSGEQKEIAKTISKAVDDKWYNWKPEDKINYLNDQAAGTSEQVTRPYVQQNSKTLTDEAKEIIISKINAIQPEAGISPENAAAIQRVKDLAIDSVTGAKDTTAIFDGRIEFDQKTNAYYNKMYDYGYAPKPVEQSALQVRSVLNGAVAQNMPKPEIFTNYLKYEHQLYRGAELINQGAGMPKNLWQRIPWWVKAGGSLWLGSKATGVAGNIFKNLTQ